MSAILGLLVGLTVPPSASSQTYDAPLSAMLQIGSRVVRTSTADALEVRLIIPPELRVYAREKISLQIRGLPSTFTAPQPLKFRMVDGSVHDVYAGSITLTASYRRGSVACGDSVVGRLSVQGCTASICFPPETIPVVAPSLTC